MITRTASFSRMDMVSVLAVRSAWALAFVYVVVCKVGALFIYGGL
jgi:hypothetical protein